MRRCGHAQSGHELVAVVQAPPTTARAALQGPKQGCGPPEHLWDALERMLKRYAYIQRGWRCDHAFRPFPCRRIVRGQRLAQLLHHKAQKCACSFAEVCSAFRPQGERHPRTRCSCRPRHPPARGLCSCRRHALRESMYVMHPDLHAPRTDPAESRGTPSPSGSSGSSSSHAHAAGAGPGPRGPGRARARGPWRAQDSPGCRQGHP